MNRYVWVLLMGGLLCPSANAGNEPRPLPLPVHGSSTTQQNIMADCRREAAAWDQHHADNCKNAGQMASNFENVANQIEAQKRQLSNSSNPPPPRESVDFRQCAALIRSTAAIKCTGNNTNSSGQSGGSGADSPGSGTSGPSWTDSPDRQSSAGGEDDYMKQLNKSAKNLQGKVGGNGVQGAADKPAEAPAEMDEKPTREDVGVMAKKAKQKSLTDMANYRGQECRFFTRPSPELKDNGDLISINMYVPPSAICHGGNIWSCEYNGTTVATWNKRGDCDPTYHPKASWRTEWSSWAMDK